MYIFNKKKKCCNHQYPDFVYFNTLLLIIYVSAIETFICRRGMSLIGSTSFGFAQNTIHDFSKYSIKLIVALSSTNATKNRYSGSEYLQGTKMFK